MDVNCIHCGQYIAQFSNFAYRANGEWRSTGGKLYCKCCFQQNTFYDALYALEERDAYVAAIVSYCDTPIMIKHDTSLKIVRT